MHKTVSEHTQIAHEIYRNTCNETVKLENYNFYCSKYIARETLNLDKRAYL